MSSSWKSTSFSPNLSHFPIEFKMVFIFPIQAFFRKQHIDCIKKNAVCQGNSAKNPDSKTLKKFFSTYAQRYPHKTC